MTQFYYCQCGDRRHPAVYLSSSCLPYSMSFFRLRRNLFCQQFWPALQQRYDHRRAILFIAVFYYLFRFTQKKAYYQLNTFLLCILFIFIGFSSWLMLPIRSNAGTTINENHPDNAQELLAYYNREQYGGPCPVLRATVYRGLWRP